MNRSQKYALVVFIALLCMSLLKDVITPDYRNTSNALFLSPEALHGASRVSTLFSKPDFWVIGILYSLFFVFVPTLIVKLTFQKKEFTLLTFTGLSLILVVLYVAIFLNMQVLDKVLVSKLNRYLHSPILVLFLTAAFTVNNLSKKDDHKPVE
ncbi:MAG: hypothetical protein ACK5XN_24325 [Bacteroidota bacterium]|jgi:hypothetical protein